MKYFFTLILALATTISTASPTINNVFQCTSTQNGPTIRLNHIQEGSLGEGVAMWYELSFSPLDGRLDPTIIQLEILTLETTDADHALLGFKSRNPSANGYVNVHKINDKIFIFANISSDDGSTDFTTEGLLELSQDTGYFCNQI